MKVLKGLVLTMLVSTATIIASVSEEGTELTTDGLTSDQIVAQTRGIGTVGDSLEINTDGSIVPNQGVVGSIILTDTVDHTSVMALSSTEVAAISLARLIGQVDTASKATIETVLGLLTTNNVSGAIDVLETGTFTSVDAGTGAVNVGSVSDVLKSEVVGTHTWKQTTTGILTAYDIGSDVSADSEGSTVFSLTVNEVAKIELSRLVTDLTTRLNTFNPFTVSATTTIDQLTSVMDSVAGAYDALSSLVGSATSELVDSDDDTGTHGGTVDDVSSSVMRLGIGTSDLQRQSTVAGQVDQESSTEEGDLS